MNTTRIAAIGVATLLGGSVLAAEVPLNSQQLSCFATQDAVLYDTPSGLLEVGYSIVASPTTTLAHAIGTQYLEQCTDGTTTYVCKMTAQEFNAHMHSNAAIPQKKMNTYALPSFKRCE